MKNTIKFTLNRKIKNIYNSAMLNLYNSILMIIISVFVLSTINIINTNNLLVFTLLVYLYKFIKFYFFIIIVPVCYITFLIKLEKFDTIKIIKATLIFRIIIFMTCIMLNYININPIFIYVLLYILIFFSFIMSNKKREWIMKLCFILSFWCLIYVGIDLIIPNLDIHIFMSSFLVYYFSASDMVYFDIDPDYLSEIYTAMHNLLMNLDIQYESDIQIPRRVLLCHICFKTMRIMKREIIIL